MFYSRIIKTYNWYVRNECKFLDISNLLRKINIMMDKVSKVKKKKEKFAVND